MVCISVIFCTILHFTTHYYEPLCAASMYCLYSEPFYSTVGQALLRVLFHFVSMIHIPTSYGNWRLFSQHPNSEKSSPFLGNEPMTYLVPVNEAGDITLCLSLQLTLFEYFFCSKIKTGVVVINYKLKT